MCTKFFIAARKKEKKIEINYEKYRMDKTM